MHNNANCYLLQQQQNPKRINFLSEQKPKKTKRSNAQNNRPRMSVSCDKPLWSLLFEPVSINHQAQMTWKMFSARRRYLNKNYYFLLFEKKHSFFEKEREKEKKLFNWLESAQDQHTAICFRPSISFVLFSFSSNNNNNNNSRKWCAYCVCVCVWICWSIDNTHVHIYTHLHMPTFNVCFSLQKCSISKQRLSAAMCFRLENNWFALLKSKSRCQILDYNFSPISDVFILLKIGIKSGSTIQYNMIPFIQYSFNQFETLNNC